MRHDAEQGLLCTDNALVHLRLILKLLDIHLGLQNALLLMHQKCQFLL